VTDIRHIDTAITPGKAGDSYTDIYHMHRYWSKKPSEVIKEYISRYTSEGDIVLDPFCGYGVTIYEALKLRRKAIGIDLNPMAHFINRVILEPVNLSRLRWAYRDIEEMVKYDIMRDFLTRCPKCGGTGVIDFVIREKDEPLDIAYRCECTRGRLFKKPDEYDKYVDETTAKRKIPYWYPKNVLLPTSQKEKFEYVHQLFTNRNLAALSMILNAIRRTDDQRVQNALKLAFTGCLDKCSRLKPLSRGSRRSGNARPTLSLSWVATRFYTPPLWQEVNPWIEFKNSFDRVYRGKKESNDLLRNVVVGSEFEDLRSGRANAIILQGSAEEALAAVLPEQSVDYILTDPPFGSSIQYLILSAFWGTWLGFTFDYGRELVVDTRRKKTRDDYYNGLRSVFYELSRVAKPQTFLNVFYNDISGPYLHEMLRCLEETSFAPECIIHQPPPMSFGVQARAEHKGNYGSYIVRAEASRSASQPIVGVSENDLRQKLAGLTLRILKRRNGEAKISTVLHSIYQQLSEADIKTFAQFDAKKFLTRATRDFATSKSGKMELIRGKEQVPCGFGLQDELRRAFLDSRSLKVKEEDNKTRLDFLALLRLKQYGVTPDDLAQIKISNEEQTEHDIQRFAGLLCVFGERLGYKAERKLNTGRIVTWTKESNLDCNFEINDSDFRVFSTVNTGNGTAEWGTVSAIRLEKQMWDWCQDNRGNDDLQELLNPLAGPSYEFVTQHRSPPRAFEHWKLTVMKNEQVCDKHGLIQLALPRVAEPHIIPGQFFHVICDPDSLFTPGGKVGTVTHLTLRRPFSCHGIQYEKFNRRLLARAGEIPIEIRRILERQPVAVDFLYKIVGKGTDNLSRVPEGTTLDAIGPCGNGFRIDEASKSKAVIVGGGIGIAPLIGLVEFLRYYDREVYVYLGAQSRETLEGIVGAASRLDSSVELGFSNGNKGFTEVVKDDLNSIGVDADKIEVCTDDGTIGRKGSVAQILDEGLSARNLSETDVEIYACGPRNMLQSVAELAQQYSINCQVLLEERMACGIGACLSCTCDTYASDGAVEKKRVCRDGPVFQSTEIKW
jgi:NAD(P)H-flavin reductase/DNA modification methylase